MIDVESVTWKTIERSIHKEIASIQTQLESHCLAMEQTEYLRGRISMCRKLLIEARPKPLPTTD